MQKRIVGVALGALLAALNLSVEAQEPKKIPRIGVLNATSAASLGIAHGIVPTRPARSGLY